MSRHAPAEKAVSTARRIVIALSASLLLGLSALTIHCAFDLDNPKVQFVSSDGVDLLVDGQAYKFTGLNVYMAASHGTCGGSTSLQQAFTGLPRGSVIRFWAFQSFFVSKGKFDWTPFDRVLAIASAYGLRVIPVLANQHEYCDGSVKDLSWYQSGYESVVWSGDIVPYKKYVAEVVSRYRSNATVAMWQFVNEAEAPNIDGICDETAASDALKAFSTTLGKIVRRIDSNHLMSLGALAGFSGTGSQYCGTANDNYGELMASDGNDVCDYHDYGFPANPLGRAEAPNLLSAMSACHAVGRPMMVGETGIYAGTEAMLGERAAQFGAKFAAQMSAGVVGELVWCWVNNPQYVIPNADPNFGVFPGDPSIAALTQIPPT